MVEQWQIEWKDYYAILEVHRNARPSRIRKCYLDLVKEYHPDTSSASGDDAKIKEINEAYEVLADPKRREEYNIEWDKRQKQGHAPTDWAYSTPPPPKVYSPTIGVDRTSIFVEAEEGHPIRFHFTVSHIDGELPPRWALGIKKNGKILDDAFFTMDPETSFPALVTVQLPPQATGEYEGYFEISIQEIA